ncbi:MAG TPA: hypothetical protein VFG53_04645 [Anaeromyxobacter sp.]|nr:hypothetical protein [Anaeromyxobacter sp.]
MARFGSPSGPPRLESAPAPGEVCRDPSLASRLDWLETDGTGGFAQDMSATEALDLLATELCGRTTRDGFELRARKALP